MLPRALADLAGRRVMVPVTGPDGARAAMSFAGEADGFARAVAAGLAVAKRDRPGPVRDDRVPPAARQRAADRRCRSGSVAGAATSPSTGRRSAATPSGRPAPSSTSYDAEHFDPLTEPLAGEIAASQVEFLRRLGLATAG